MEVKEGTTIPPNPKAEAAKRFVTQYFQTPIPGRKNWEFDFDISGGNGQALRKIASGQEFELSNFRAAPKHNDSEKRETYHFYIDDTEFHIQGKAAEEVDKIKTELEQGVPRT